jgi:hypothetical protein
MFVHGLDAFEGTVVAVTHDGGSPAASTGSWSSAGRDDVYEADQPVCDEGRVQRAR